MKMKHRFVIPLLVYLCALAAACHRGPASARLASTPADFARLNLTADIQTHEDGMRTDGRSGNFEWWYFDGHLTDGTKIVVVFFTKPMTEQDSELSPFVTIHIDYPDGRKIEKSVIVSPDEFSASKEKCDVKIGANYFRGDLQTYEIFTEIENVRVDLRLESQVPSYRPATGYLLFGEKNYFAWLAAVPRGKISGTLVVDGESRAIDGSGYHDHNWGDIGPHIAMSNWYWARAEIGEYTVITSYITAEERFGHAKFPMFMLARGREIIAAEGYNYMTFEREDLWHHEKTGKPIDNVIRSIYKDGDTEYTVEFRREKNILDYEFITHLDFFKATIARLVGFDGAYHRFVGRVKLDVREGARRETHEGDAIWELMYFGSNLD